MTANAAVPANWAERVADRSESVQRSRARQMEQAHATQHFTDLVLRQLLLANEEGLLASPDPERDAWYVTKLVMAVFHHYAYAGDPEDARATGEELWEFCLRALGGRVT